MKRKQARALRTELAQAISAHGFYASSSLPPNYHQIATVAQNCNSVATVAQN